MGALAPRARSSPAAGSVVSQRAQHSVRVLPIFGAELLGQIEPDVRLLDAPVDDVKQAAGGRIEAIVGDIDPFLAVRDALERTPFDEVITSTLPRRVSHWLRLDLRGRVERLGVLVTVVTAVQSERARKL
jgi:hypothetical protein